MAASAGAIRAGAAYVEIFANDSKFQQGMTRVRTTMATVGQQLRRAGTSMFLGGAAIGAPLMLAVRSAANFENALFDAKASAGLTAAEVEKVKQKSLELSKAGLGGPAAIAQAFTALVKAGMPLEQALGGAAEAVVQFASNAGIDVTQAAEVASDAMNVFGVSSKQATDILKAAADSSSTSVEGLVQAFAQSSAAAGMANQSMDTLSAALAIMAQNGVKGSDAGTSIKTMLLRLAAPSNEAAQGLQSIGLSVNSFRGADGKMLPLANVLDILGNSLAGLDGAQRDQTLLKIFGTDAIRSGTILLNAGSAGMAKMAQAMAASGTNADAYKTRMSGITGSMITVSSAVERLQIAVATALAPAFRSGAQALASFLDFVGGLVTRFPGLVTAAGALSVALLGIGAASIAIGVGLQGFAFGLKAVQSIMTTLPALFSPTSLAIIGIGAAIAGVVVIARTLSPAFREETDAIGAALMRLDFGAAWEVMNTNVAIALVQMHQAFAQTFDGIYNTVAAASSFIGDMMIEGMDRFMGLFDADILTLQEGFQKLGVYFRAAFDWDFAVNGMSDALRKIDADIEEARKRAPTAEARADERRVNREQAAQQRQLSNDQRDAAFQGTIDELRRDNERAKQRALGVDAEPDEVTPAGDRKPVAPTVAGGMPVATPQQAAAAGETQAGIGQAAGTFGSAAGLGIAPELAKLEDPAKQTAENTAATAAAVAALGDKGSANSIPASFEDAVKASRGGAFAAIDEPNAPQLTETERLMAEAEARNRGEAPATVAAGPSPVPLPLSSPTAIPIGAEVAAPRAAATQAAITTGTEEATTMATLNLALKNMAAQMVAAADRTTDAVMQTIGVLKQIADNTTDLGSSFL